jgi:hypothetical protein
MPTYRSCILLDFWSSSKPRAALMVGSVRRSPGSFANGGFVVMGWWQSRGEAELGARCVHGMGLQMRLGSVFRVTVPRSFQETESVRRTPVKFAPCSYSLV